MINSGSADLHGVSENTWFGFVINSVPQLSGNCSGLDENGQAVLDLIMSDEPGFGYGPLMSNLYSYLAEDHYGNWNDIEGYAFTGIVSSLALSENGERAYLDMNIAYAYPLENGITTWDPNHAELPQGTELSLSDLPSDAFYYSLYFFGIGLH